MRTLLQEQVQIRLQLQAQRLMFLNVSKYIVHINPLLQHLKTQIKTNKNDEETQFKPASGSLLRPLLNVDASVDEHDSS